MFTSTTRGSRASSRRKGGRFTILLVLVALFAFAIPASATTTRVDFSAAGQVIGALDAGDSWVSGDILHVRNYRPVVAMTIDADGFPDDGVAYGAVNFNLDQRTGHGQVWGNTVFEIGDGGFDCTASGDIAPAAVPGGLLGEFEAVCHGFDQYEGVQIRGTIVELVGIGQQTVEGFSFIPGDR
jgi:hypothetical protein